MRIRPEQLGGHLQQQLLPLYLVTGDTTLLVQEACDAIRARARDEGIIEREVLDAGPRFDWQQLPDSAANLSLFAERRLLELRIPSGKPGTEGSRALQDYLASGSDDLLLIVAGKIDKASTNSKWFKALDAAGAVVQIWPVGVRELPNWMRQRLHSSGLNIDKDALQLLCERIEGNLLAAVQEIEKLKLLAEGEHIDLATVTAAVADSARYDLFGLVDTALAGDARNSLRMLHGLRAEGTDANVVLWGVNRELQTLRNLHRAAQAGEAFGQACKRLRIWDSKARVLQPALKRHNTDSLQRLLTLCLQADGRIKGYATGDAWLSLELLLVTLALGERAPLATAAAL